MIEIGFGVAIDPDELEFSYSRSSGPGGQHVNKVESRVTLRYNIAASPALTGMQKRRLQEVLRTRINRDGVLALHCQAHRSQARNRTVLLERFRELLAEALRPRKQRRKTAPGRAARERRMSAKKRKGDIKRGRKRPGADD